MKKAFCFDLFWTLVGPWFPETDSEYERAGLTKEQYHDTFEERSYCIRRNKGEFKTVADCMTEFGRLNPQLNLSQEQLDSIAQARLLRMEKCLVNVDEKILSVLREIKNRGYILSLISNADPFDHCYWEKSPLVPLFDHVTFSGKIGYLKPEPEIYQTALNKMNLPASDCYFIGDGGHEELDGAKEAGFTTIFSEYILHKSEDMRQKILKSADYNIKDFEELLSFE